MSTQPYSLQVDSNAARPRSASTTKRWMPFMINFVVLGVGILFGRFAISRGCPSCRPCATTSTNSPNTTLTPSPAMSPTIATTAHSEEIQMAKRIASSLGLDEYASLFDPQNDAYIDYTSADDYAVYGGRVTATAKGWVKLGLNTEIKGKDVSDWSMSYHGNTRSTISSIFASNLTLLKTGDTIPGTNTTVSKPWNHIQSPFVRYNEYTNQTELFDPEQVFMTPSILFASLYAQKTYYVETSGDKILYQVVFEAAFRNVSDENIGQTQTVNYVCSDGMIQYNQIEWYTKRNVEDIVLTGMLLNMHKMHAWKTYSAAHVTLTEAYAIVTRTAVGSGSVLSPVSLEPFSSGSGFYEYYFKIKAVSNTDQIRFGLVDETHAVYWWSAAGNKRYSRSETVGVSEYATETSCGTDCTVVMKVDLYKYEVRFAVNGYRYDVAWQLPQRELEYTPTVWMGNEWDQIQLYE